MASCDKMLSVKDSLLLKFKKHEKYQICVIDLVSHQGITLILFGRPAIQVVCIFDKSFTYLTFICLYPLMCLLKTTST